MTILRTEPEIEVLREANQVVAEVLVMIAGMVEPGITTRELDAAAEEYSGNGRVARIRSELTGRIEEMERLDDIIKAMENGL